MAALEKLNAHGEMSGTWIINHYDRVILKVFKSLPEPEDPRPDQRQVGVHVLKGFISIRLDPVLMQQVSGLINMFNT